MVIVRRAPLKLAGQPYLALRVPRCAQSQGFARFSRHDANEFARFSARVSLTPPDHATIRNGLLCTKSNIKMNQAQNRHEHSRISRLDALDELARAFSGKQIPPSSLSSGIRRIKMAPNQFFQHSNPSRTNMHQPPHARTVRAKMRRLGIITTSADSTGKQATEKAGYFPGGLKRVRTPFGTTQHFQKV